jgi:hypothetical protein
MALDPAHISDRTSETAPPRRRLGLSLGAIVGLALLAVPRVVLHDLGVITEGTFVNALLVFVPPAIWIAVVLARRVPNPFPTLLAVGLCYGVLLAIGHQLLWDINVGDAPPRLGGNLADVDPALQNVIFRVFAFGSSIVTGTLVGAVAGAIAAAIRAILKPRA